MKILHVVENLDKGAVENWLVNVFLESRKYRPEWKWTFYCLLGREGKLDRQVREAGGDIIYAPFWLSEKIRMLRHLRGVLRAGHYDILHVHHDYLSGFYLLSVAGLPVRRRILHIHNTDRSLPVGDPRLRKLLLKPLRNLGVRLSDTVVGISRDTLAEFLQGIQAKGKRTEVLYYGIDLTRFRPARTPGWLRAELNWPEQARVLLFTGRMNELKNPVFVIEILRALHLTRKDVYALFIGKGGKEDAVREKAVEYGLEEYIHLAGWRDDVAEIMAECDLFVFPRIEYPREGLGLVVVEAQSAGLPMLLSHGIVTDAVVISGLAQFIHLRDNAGEWAAAASQMLDKGKPMSREDALSAMEGSCFALPRATRNLIALYEQH